MPPPSLLLRPWTPPPSYPAGGTLPSATTPRPRRSPQKLRPRRRLATARGRRPFLVGCPFPPPFPVRRLAMADMTDELAEIPNLGAVPKKAPKVMNWTPPMSAMMLKGLSEVAARGCKTDKGFKEAEKLKVANRISSFVGYDVSITQVHNHIRKWRNKWTRVVYLKGLSGALWDDDKKMVLLEEQHYLGHTLDHPTDAELLNSPLENYNYMELCFAHKQATGKYVMGSGVPLGTPLVVEDKDVPNVMEGQGTTDEVSQHLPGSNFVPPPNASATQDPSPTSSKKRKRASVLTEEDAIQVSNMSDAVREIATAINNTCHAETHPDLYKAVMDLVVFDLDQRLGVLDYLTEHKAKGLNFLKMDAEVREASFNRILKNNPNLI